MFNQPFKKLVFLDKMTRAYIIEVKVFEASLNILYFSDDDLRNIIDRLANFVSRNGPQFEEMTRQKQQHNKKFSFLFGGRLTLIRSSATSWKSPENGPKYHRNLSRLKLFSALVAAGE